MASTEFIKTLKQLDGYPKTLDDYRIRTLEGGAVTLLSYVVIVVLILSELKLFLTPEINEELFVDTSREPKLKINLNITLPAIPCKYLSVDAMDSSGEQHLQIDHSIYKVSIDPNGNIIDQPTKEELKKSSSTLDNKTEVAEIKCGSCYGAESAALNITCCNTCAEVRDAYFRRKWSFPDPQSIEQCKNSQTDGLLNEGCKIYGSMEVNRVGGSFHVAPGESFSINHIHVHDVQPFSASSFNTSHVIDHLSFGYNIPGKTDHLDGTIAIAKQGATMFQYYIKIVPTTYMYEGPNYLWSKILTNQFSVTRHVKSESGSAGMPPGIFFTYELAPFMVKYKESWRSIGHFATNICAIIGGVFTVASIIDTLVYRSVQVMKKKIEIGKAY